MDKAHMLHLLLSKYVFLFFTNFNIYSLVSYSVFIVLYPNFNIYRHFQTLKANPKLGPRQQITQIQDHHIQVLQTKVPCRTLAIECP